MESKRICDITGEEMDEGFLFHGDFYVKHEKDALKYAKKHGYKDLDESYEDEFHYWTEWEE